MSDRILSTNRMLNLRVANDIRGQAKVFGLNPLFISSNNRSACNDLSLEQHCSSVQGFREVEIKKSFCTACLTVLYNRMSVACPYKKNVCELCIKGSAGCMQLHNSMLATLVPLCVCIRLANFSPAESLGLPIRGYVTMA